MNITKTALRQVLGAIRFDPTTKEARIIYESSNPAVYVARAVADLKMMQLQGITITGLISVIRTLAILIIIMEAPDGKARVQNPKGD
jgi:hypothetical protein